MAHGDRQDEHRNGGVERRNDGGTEARARRRPGSWPSVVEAIEYVERAIAEGEAEALARSLLKP